MRRWLVILMILFTPLRGLAADVMAISMAGQQGVAAHHGTMNGTPVMGSVADALPDCAEHHGTVSTPAPSAAQDAQAVAPDGDCPTCASCMVCSSAALAMASGLSPMVPLHHALPAPGIASFRSAAPLPGFKPPIS